MLITTPRLCLRPLQDEDAPGLLALCGDARVMRYWSSTPWTELAQAQAAIAGEQAGWARGESLALAILRQGDGAMLGRCTLFAHAPAHRRAELGFALMPPHWGQGYAREAVSALLEWGFEGPWHLHRVEADVDPRNTASLHCLARLGFQHEGVLAQRWWVGDEACDSVLLGLLRSQR